MGNTETMSSTTIDNLWVITEAGLLIADFSGEEDSEDADLVAGFLVAFMEFAKEYAGSNMRGVIMDDHQLHFSTHPGSEIIAVARTPQDFGRVDDLRNSLLFVLDRFRRANIDLNVIDDEAVASVKTEIESFLVYNGLLEKPTSFHPKHNEMIIDNIGRVISLAYHEKTRHIVVGSDDNFVKVYGLGGGEVLFLPFHRTPIVRIILLEAKAVTFDVSGEVIFWDIPSFELQDQLHLSKTVRSAHMCLVSPTRIVVNHGDGFSVLIQNQDGSFAQLESWSRQVFEELLEVEPDLIYVDFVYDGQQIFLLDEFGRYFFLDSTDHSVLHEGWLELSEGHKVLTADRLRRADEVIISTTMNEMLRFDLNSLTSYKVRIKVDGKVDYIHYLEKLDCLALGHNDGSISLLIDYMSADPFVLKFDAHDESVVAITYLEREDGLITAASDRDIRIWRGLNIGEARETVTMSQKRLRETEKTIKEIIEWLEENYSKEIVDPRQIIIKVGLYKSRLISSEKWLMPSRPWWLPIALSTDITRIKTRIERGKALM